MAPRDDVAMKSSDKSGISKILIRVMPYLLAIFFALWGLRGVGCNNVVETDAARHAMNGVFIYDLIRGGQWTSPIDFGKFYYSRLPALSLPYHPPGFSVIEALFFSGLGVNVLAARLAVALCVFVSVVLLYRLLMSTHGSGILAISATVTFFSMRSSQSLANGVALEFPSLVFALGAIYCLRDLRRGYSLRRGLAFAILSGAAVWTKQHTVFLGFVPFFYVLFSRQWRLLRGKTIWISSAIFGIIVFALTALSFPFKGTGALQGLTFYRFSANTAGKIALDSLGGYIHELFTEFGPVPIILSVLMIIGALFIPKLWKKLKASNALYLAWAVAALLILLTTWHVTKRYLFYMYLPVIFLGYVILYRGCVFFLRRFSLARYLPIFIAVLYCTYHLPLPHNYLYGPSQAASHVVTGSPARILYCGQTDGSFIFAARSLDPNLQTVVLRGEKLPPATFSADELERFAHRFGVNYIVLEETSMREYKWLGKTMTAAWNQLNTSPAPSMVLERVIPMSSSKKSLNGRLYIYRFTNPAPLPERLLKTHLNLVGDDIDLQF